MHDKDIISDIAHRRENGEVFCVATVVRALAATAAKAGSKAVIGADGSIISGFVGGACVQGAVCRTAQEVLHAGQARLIRVKPADEVHACVDQDGVEVHKSGCPSRGTVDIFIEPMNPPPQVCIVGAAPVALALAEQAVLLGYRVLAVSDNGDDANKFPIAVCYQPQLTFADGNVSERDYVVVAAQGRNDLAALKAALATPARYVSMVCSRAKAAALCAQLEDDGGDRLAISRFKAPAGLDIQAIEPREIALSILAEIIQHRRRDSRVQAAAE